MKLLLVLELYIVETFPQYHVPILRTMVLQKTEFISFLTFLLNPNFTCLTASHEQIKIQSQSIFPHIQIILKTECSRS